LIKEGIEVFFVALPRGGKNVSKQQECFQRPTEDVQSKIDTSTTAPPPPFFILE